MAYQKKAVREKKDGVCKFVYEWVEAITVALAVVVLIFAFCFRLISVDGTSMMPTLANGERLVLSRLPYTPARGDIVVINYEDTIKGEPLIKRIIGLPGDTIEINGDTGEVLLNGEVLDEPYVHVPTATEDMTGVVTVPAGQVFVMGDNRAYGRSLDSRSFGCVDQSQLMGKAVFRLFPLDRFGGLYDES